jgi:hypothetical protein
VITAVAHTEILKTKLLNLNYKGTIIELWENGYLI